MNNTKPTQNCKSCGATLSEDAHFCSQCGSKTILEDRSHLFSPKYILLSCATGSLVWAAIWFNQSGMLGPKPTETYSPTSQTPHTSLAPRGTTQTYNDPEVERLRKATKASPDDATAWISLGKLLIEKVRNKTVPSNQGVLEAIDALGTALDLRPNDKDTLLLLADLSFEQRAFAKAEEYYAKLLTSSPQTPELLGRYASTLTFLGEHTRAIEALSELITNHPEHFQGHAFLSIAYAQSGNKEKALEVGTKALGFAPSDESRARFQLFLDSLNRSEPNHPPLPNSLEGFFLSHPIVGPKVERHSYTDGSFSLYLNNFPMDKMPTAAKEKFYQSIREFLIENPQQDISSILFIDSHTNAELGSFTVGATK